MIRSVLAGPWTSYLLKTHSKGGIIEIAKAIEKEHISIYRWWRERRSSGEWWNDEFDDVMVSYRLSSLGKEKEHLIFFVFCFFFCLKVGCAPFTLKKKTDFILVDFFH
jgi:hypothetical protein